MNDPADRGVFLLDNFISMKQKAFAQHIARLAEEDESIIGLAAAGSWITDEMDEYSDLDLVLFTSEKISGDPERMRRYAERFGTLLSTFTGDHVGEPRLLICLYDDPFLHVDIKFLTANELNERIEDPVILLDKTGELKEILNRTAPVPPIDSFQWIEDRFWVWIHYLAARLGRAEYFECIDGLTYIRSRVLGPLLHLKYQRSPRGVRRLEKIAAESDLAVLKQTVPGYDRAEIVRAIEKTAEIYKSLRAKLFTPDVELQTEAEKRALNYLGDLEWN